MREGVSKGYVLPKALTEKIIPQIKDLAAKLEPEDIDELEMEF